MLSEADISQRKAMHSKYLFSEILVLTHTSPNPRQIFCKEFKEFFFALSHLYSQLELGG